MSGAASADRWKLLILDFCGEEPWLALAAGNDVQQRAVLPDRSAAAEWLPAAKRLLQAQRWELRHLQAVGVVGGPGSFTGVRTGMAAAVGLCEAASLRLAVVSRLAVLSAASRDAAAVAILYAARDRVYCRVPAEPGHPAAEEVVLLQDLEGVVCERAVVVAEPRLLPALLAFNPRVVRLGPEEVLAVAHEALRCGGTEMTQADANYVRSESQIYRRVAFPQL